MSKNLFSLEGKVIVVTGALGLIGKEICDAFCEAGGSVVIADVKDGELCVAHAKELEKHHGTQCLGIHVDITSDEMVGRLFDEIIKVFGRVDVLVNNAAIDAKFDDRVVEVSGMPFEQFPIELWERSLAVNMTGLLRVTQQAVPHMLQRKSGNIVNVASTYALVAPDQRLYLDPEKTFIPKPVDYVATKSMVPNFTRYLATYYGHEGIRANVIVPHGVVTNHDARFQQRFAERSPLGRMCRVEELRGPFVFLASDASSYMTGSMLVVDGGWTAW